MKQWMRSGATLCEISMLLQQAPPVYSKLIIELNVSATETESPNTS